MEVKHVHVVQGQQVDVFLDEVRVEEMTAHVKMHAPIAEPRTVGDGGGGQDHLLPYTVAGQRLPEHLDTVEDTGRCRTADADAFLTDADTIALLRRDGLVQSERDGVLHLTASHLHLDTGVGTDVLLEELGVACHRSVVIGYDDGVLVKDKRFPLLHDDLVRERYHLIICGDLCMGGQHR